MVLLTQSTLPAGLSDAELVERARGEDGQAAFRVIYDRYRDSIHAFLCKVLNDSARAEDILQDAFFRVHMHLDRFDTKRAFRPWLYRIARNAALDAIRARKKEKRRGEVIPTTDAGGADELVGEVQRREEIRRLQSALASLPAEARALLVQRHGMCMKLTELAESFDCTERTVRNRLKRAAALLAEALVRGDGGRS